MRGLAFVVGAVVIASLIGALLTWLIILGAPWWAAIFAGIYVALTAPRAIRHAYEWWWLHT